ncbi:hypothetical protein [Sulfurospirillum multivorans]|uniref:hypothetical protein n=1 Tax=Sulfurospirillum multivorans TaxID=66821 RepID=UPI00130E18BC|nr:hypothetical protein [Sulfurospirillum multivorans]
MSEFKQNENFASIHKSQIIVLTHNPKGKWGDVRDTIEQGLYKGWGESDQC